jgi:hypothetical protein
MAAFLRIESLTHAQPLRIPAATHQVPFFASRPCPAEKNLLL